MSCRRRRIGFEMLVGASVSLRSQIFPHRDAQAIKCEGIVSLIDWHPPAGPEPRYALVFESLDATLDEYMRTPDYRSVPVPRRRDLVIALVDVLARLHGFGVVHGDLKPSNIMVQVCGSMCLYCDVM